MRRHRQAGFTLLEVLIALEEFFGVVFNPEELTDQNLGTQESILKTLQRLQGAR